MIWRILGIGGGVVAAVVVAALMGDDEPEHEQEKPVRPAERPRPLEPVLGVFSGAERSVLGGLGLLAVLTTVLLLAFAATEYAVIPITVLLIVGGAAYVSAEARARKEAVAARAQKVEKRNERVRRIKELSRSGVILLERAQAAVRAIHDTEVARTGWLGDAGELDFSADLAFIEDNARKARQLHRLIAELEAIPAPTADDQAMVGEARATIGRLADASIERTRMLETRADTAQRLDDALRDDRMKQRNELKRDDVRTRMAVLLARVDTEPPHPPSDSADKVSALAAAISEIRGDDTVDPPASVATDAGAPTDPAPLPAEPGDESRTEAGESDDDNIFGRVWGWITR